MKITLITGAIFFTFYCGLHAQTPSLNWGKALGGNGTVEPYVIAVDTDGGVITAGELSNLAADFNPAAGTFSMTPTAPSYVDMYISKLDENGNFLWAKQLPSLWQPEDIKTDAANNIYIVGYYDGDEDFDPGVGVVNLDPAGGAYVLKLNSSGNFVAAHRIAELAEIQTLYVSDAGDMYTAGRFYGTSDFDPGTGIYSLTPIGTYDYFISHLDPSGNLVWAGHGGAVSSTNAIVYDLVVDDSGNIYSTGSFGSTTDMDPGAGIYNLTASNGDAFVSKITPAGNLVWCKQLGGADQYDVGNRIDFDTAGNIYIGGKFSSTNADFNPGSGTYLLSATHWTGDLFFVKLGPDGSFSWAKQFTSNTLTNSDYLTDMEADAFGNLYATGYMNGTIDFDPGTGTFNLTTADYAAFNFKLNTSGELTYAFLFDASGFDYGQGLTVENNTLYLTGAFVNAIDFNPGAGTSTMNAGSTHDGYIVKMNNCDNGSFSTVTTCGNYTWPATGLTYNSSGTYSATLSNIAGCDSTAILSLSINTPATGIDVQTACNTFTWMNGITYTASTNLPTHILSGEAANGCDSIVTLNLTMEDTQDPVADAVTLATISSQCSVTSLTAPTATDNCAGTILGTHNATLPITTPGTTVVTWVYDDGNGNIFTQNQNVIVEDNTNPVANVSALANITSECSVTSLTAPTATDNCAGTLTGTHNATLPITTPGTTVVTWTYDDGNGNTVTQNQNVLIDPIDNSVSVNTITLTATANGYTYQWIDCGNGNAPISGETNQSFTATSNGTYAVEISNGMCSVTSACTAITQVGIDENKDHTLVIYPNPFIDELTIKSTEIIHRMKITNHLGQVVLETWPTSTNVQFNLSEVGCGVYHVYIETENGQSVHLLLKEN